MKFWLYCSIALCCSINVSNAADLIGLSLPLDSRYSKIAERLEFGANLAVADLRATGQDVRITLFDDHCDPKLSNIGADRFLANNTKVVVGPLCFDTAVSLAKSLNPTSDAPPVPVLALGTRNPLLKRAREYDQLPLSVIGHKADAEAQAFVEFVLPRFGERPYGIADDGSAHGRGLADQIRLAAEKDGKKPAALAAFRPLQTNQKSMLRQLQRSGVEALIINGPAEDVVTIIRDMKSLGLNWPVAVGEQAALLAFAEGARDLDHNIILVHETLPRLQGAEDLVARLEELQIPPDRSLFEGYMLVQVAAQAANRNLKDLSAQSFDSIYGPIRFGEDGLANIAPFELYRWNGTAFVSEAAN